MKYLVWLCCVWCAAAHAATEDVCKGVEPAPEFRRCLTLALEESADRLHAKEAELAKHIEQAPTYLHPGLDVAMLKQSAAAFLQYQKHECAIREFWWNGFSAEDGIVRGVLCEIELNRQRLEMLDKLFPNNGMPVI